MGIRFSGSAKPKAGKPKPTVVADLKEMVEKHSKPAKPSKNKTRDSDLITLRVEHDLLNWLKSFGKGWQTKLKSILREAMEKSR